MTTKTLFLSRSSPPYFEEVNIVFDSTNGQKLHELQKAITALHAEIQKQFDGLKLLEVSSRSPDPLGYRLSAFNLHISVEDSLYPVESVYQSTKCFESAGPNQTLRGMSPAKAKVYYRGKKLGHLRHFCFEQRKWPLVSSPNFYDYLYIRALMESELHSQVLGYSGFTDIAYVTPKLKSTKSRIFNCQARALAIYQGVRENCTPMKSLNIVRKLALNQGRVLVPSHLPLFD